MPPKKAVVPWFVTQKAKTTPFDKFMADIAKSLNVTTDSRLDPDWDIYVDLMEKPENQQFKTMKDSKGMTAEDYGFKAFVTSIKNALDVDPPHWAYYRDNSAYLPEFKDRKDENGKTVEDYAFEVFMEIIDSILDRENDFESPEWNHYVEYLKYLPELKDKKDSKGKSAVDYGMEVLVNMIKNHEDKSKYGILLEDMPEFFNLKDASGKTPVMYAAESGEADYMLSMIETPGVDVRIKDNEGKTVYQYYEKFLNEETEHLKKTFANDPDTLAEELDDIESSRKFFLKAIKDAEAKLVARDVASLATASKDISGIGGPIPAVGEIASFLTGQKGDPKAQLKAAREQLGKGRKTRRKSKKSKKSRRV